MLVTVSPPLGGLSLSSDTRALAVEAAARLKQSEEIKRFLLSRKVPSTNPAFPLLVEAAQLASRYHQEAEAALLAAVPDDAGMAQPAEPQRRRRRRKAEPPGPEDGREG